MIYLGAVWERCTMTDGKIKTVKIELWRKPDGERCFGKILEVL